MNIITVENVEKTFTIPYEKRDNLRESLFNMFKPIKKEQFKVLNGVNFVVERGEFLGIIGHNGSGKSTLLKTLAGIYSPDKGDIQVQGTLVPFLELGVGFNPELSGRDNIYLNAVILGLTEREIEKRFWNIVEFAGIGKFIDQKLKNYSSGMQVRLAFSVAIQAKSDIILLDEVLAVGDQEFQDKCFREFERLKKEKRTIVFVSHSLDQIERFCDRVLLMDKGKAVFIGDPKKAILHYNERIHEAKETKTTTAVLEESKKGEGDYYRFGSREIAIEKVVCTNTKGVPQKVFEEGEDLLIQFHYHLSNSAIKKAVFGLEVFNEEKKKIYGTHMLQSTGPVSVRDSGMVTCKVVASRLLPGTYYYSPAVADEYAQEQYDYHDRSHSFVIAGSKRFEGVINLDVTWK